MTTPYLNEAQNLYEEKEYGECLQLLYKQNTTAQWCVWSIILFSLLIDGLTIFVSVYLKQFTTVAALVAGAAVEVGVDSVSYVPDKHIFNYVFKMKDD